MVQLGFCFVQTPLITQNTEQFLRETPSLERQEIASVVF